MKMKNYLSMAVVSSIVMSSTGFAQVSQTETNATAQIEQLLTMNAQQSKDLIASEKASLSSILAAVQGVEASLLRAKQARQGYNSNYQTYEVSVNLRNIAIFMLIPTGLNALSARMPKLNDVLRDYLRAQGEVVPEKVQSNSLLGKYMRNTGKVFIGTAIIAAASELVREGAYTESMRLNEDEISTLESIVRVSKSRISYQQDLIDVLEKRISLGEKLRK